MGKCFIESFMNLFQWNLASFNFEAGVFTFYYSQKGNDATPSSRYRMVDEEATTSVSLASTSTWLWKTMLGCHQGSGWIIHGLRSPWKLTKRNQAPSLSWSCSPGDLKVIDNHTQCNIKFTHKSKLSPSWKHRYTMISNVSWFGFQLWGMLS